MKTIIKRAEANEHDGLTGWRYRFFIVVILLCSYTMVGLLYYSVFSPKASIEKETYANATD